jgi:hypothetical protein
MLTVLKQQVWLKARGKQRTDSTHVLAKLRAINRLVCVGETLRHALNCLAIVAPDGLLAPSQPEWADRSDMRLEDSRLPSSEGPGFKALGTIEWHCPMPSLNQTHPPGSQKCLSNTL